jgi:uncharacterized protein (DUF983 family)
VVRLGAPGFQSQFRAAFSARGVMASVHWIRRLWFLWVRVGAVALLPMHVVGLVTVVTVAALLQMRIVAGLTIGIAVATTVSTHVNLAWAS